MVKRKYNYSSAWIGVGVWGKDGTCWLIPLPFPQSSITSFGWRQSHQFRPPEAMVHLGPAQFFSICLRCTWVTWGTGSLHPNYRSSIWHISIVGVVGTFVQPLQPQPAPPDSGVFSPSPNPFLSQSWREGALSTTKWPQHQSKPRKELTYPGTEAHSHLVVDGHHCSSFYLESNQFLTNTIQGEKKD